MRRVMQRGRRRERRALLGAAVALVAEACSPTEIAERQFMSLEQSCYERPLAPDAGSFYDGTVRPAGCELKGSGGADSGSGGSETGGVAGYTLSGSASVSVAESAVGGSAAAGGSAVGGSGQAGAVQGGAGGALPEAGGAAGASAGAGGATGGAPSALSSACSALAEARKNDMRIADATLRASFADAETDTDVVVALFRSPLAVGGCQDEEFCHLPADTGVLPDLSSEGVVERLLDRRGDCDTVWITRGGGLESSSLWLRLTDYWSNAADPPECEDAMPDANAGGQQLQANDLECLREWILQVAATP